MKFLRPKDLFKVLENLTKGILRREKFKNRPILTNHLIGWR
jgi:hypothetical protein